VSKVPHQLLPNFVSTLVFSEVTASFGTTAGLCFVEHAHLLGAAAFVHILATPNNETKEIRQKQMAEKV
jgi:hypothetical protein